jgi:hypothetical protein
MTSFKQWQANRRNARKSTGPITEEGKRISRRNAVRHGLSAETVIRLLEDTTDYRAFEATIIADYDAQSAVERELVLRLASLLWRLRRATTFETGLFEIQANELSREFEGVPSTSITSFHSFPDKSADFEQDSNLSVVGTSSKDISVGSAPRMAGSTNSTAVFAQCFLRLANMPSYAFDRLSRYEASLWRQAARVLLALENLERRKPHERRPLQPFL